MFHNIEEKQHFMLIWSMMIKILSHIINQWELLGHELAPKESLIFKMFKILLFVHNEQVWNSVFVTSESF